MCQSPGAAPEKHLAGAVRDPAPAGPFEEFRRGWRKVSRDWWLFLCNLPGAFGLAILNQPDVPWPDEIIVLVASLGVAITLVLWLLLARILWRS